jgi:hypothetical protein
MNIRAESTVARCRERLQNDKYPTIASRYPRRSRSLSRTRASTAAQLGNQTPSAVKRVFIYQSFIWLKPVWLSQSNMATQKHQKTSGQKRSHRSQIKS